MTGRMKRWVLGTQLTYPLANSRSSICTLFPPWLEVYADAPLCLVWGKEFVVGFPPVVKPRQAPMSPGLDTGDYLCSPPPRRPWRSSGQVQLLHLPGWGQVYQAIRGQSWSKVTVGTEESILPRPWDDLGSSELRLKSVDSSGSSQASPTGVPHRPIPKVIWTSPPPTLATWRVES